MAIPKYDETMLPVLQMLADGVEHATRDLAEPMANHFHRMSKEQ